MKHTIRIQTWQGDDVTVDTDILIAEKEHFEAYKRFLSMNVTERKIVNEVTGFPVNSGIALVTVNEKQVSVGQKFDALSAAYYELAVRGHLAELKRRGVRAV